MERQDSIESHTSNPPPPPDPELKILFLYSVFLALDRMHNAYMSIQLEMANIKVASNDGELIEKEESRRTGCKLEKNDEIDSTMIDHPIIIILSP